MNLFLVELVFEKKLKGVFLFKHSKLLIKKVFKTINQKKMKVMTNLLVLFSLLVMRLDFVGADGVDMLSYQKISNSHGDLDMSILESSGFGASVAKLGDLNNDGQDELVVGSPALNNFQGAVYILFLNTDGTGTVDFSVSLSEIGLTLADNDVFGQSCAGLTDINQNNVADLVVGASGTDDSKGAIYVFFLGSDGMPLSYQKISSEDGDLALYLTLPGNSNFGTGVSGLPELDGDGTYNLLVGASGDSYTTLGDAYILSIDERAYVIGVQVLTSSSAFTAALSDDEFGYSLDMLSDGSGSGGPTGEISLVIGAHNNDDGATDAGCIYILFLNLNNNNDLLSFQKISNTQGSLDIVLSEAATFGKSVASAGDVNGDGLIDVVAGRPGGASDSDPGTTGTTSGAGSSSGGYGKGSSDDPETGGGDAILIFLSPSGTCLSSQALTSGSAVFTVGVVGSDYFGLGVGGQGWDVNGDAIPDVVVGVPGDDDGDMDSGSVYIIFNNPAFGTVPIHR